MLRRYVSSQIESDLTKKMVFLAGPRQVGKTTVSENIYNSEHRLYLNWDIDPQRTRILKRQFGPEPLWIFDEIHKYRKWRNYLKGVFDEFKNKKKILVTGSAKLDVYRFGGDSLQGRYFFIRLHPLSLAELGDKHQSTLEELFQLGAFPEPFFSNSKTEANRWTKDHASRILREEVSSLEQVQDLGTMELLGHRLPELVGSPLSINALREDLQVHFVTVKKWLEIMERLYIIFRLSPFGSPQIKAVKKEQKHYHFDWNLIEQEGPRFENLIAVHLQKYVHWLEDTQGLDIQLKYLRSSDKKEVDFVICEKRKPTKLIECKLTDEDISPHLIYFKRKFPEAEAFQIYLRGKKDFISKDSIRLMPAARFLSELV